MKQLLLFISVIFFSSCATQKAIDISEVAQSIDAWHKAASQANFKDYFDLMTDDAVFIGTDATENWQVADFKAYSKPYFDKGKAWSFTSLERHVYSQNRVTYFDELLDTQMGICRGSGVMKMQDGKWKIAHYVLSIAVPNENVSSLTEMKKEWDKNYIKQLLNQ
ncbi:nuclear transport factor 2 family protein [Nonlabens sp. Ci31]|jgi:ketosteroid isomerase-like protein|uniref:nuclear transport factor 2 family protein n=1 Tax=Nonlabens sp. Ci31 TaxID=2608253 RepID=UPI0014640565|nr:nuclear transport factor 2 family protein [Nonlabens sp. Ci31]QJP33883.1 nuclear transport factor 2 family protein [Nonlabens sp. Ci31]